MTRRTLAVVVVLAALSDVASARLVFRHPLRVTTRAGECVPQAAGDFNGDGKQDFLSVSNAKVEVFLGAGNGSFGAPMTTVTPAGFTSFQDAGDVNGDGKLDVLLSEHEESVQILLGNGAGGFTLGAALHAERNVDLARFGDITGDGKLDVVIHDQKYGSYWNWLGDGGGGFSGPYSMDDDANWTSDDAMEIADVNGDGRGDLITARGKLMIRLATGTAEWTSRLELGPASTLAARDLDNDGDVDIASDRSVYLNNGSGVFTAGQTYSTFTYSPKVRPGNVNGDTHVDLIVTVLSHAMVLLGAGNGTFAPAGYFLAGGGPGDYDGGITADFDGDGRTDVLASGSGQVVLSKGKSDGTLDAPRAWPNAGAVVLADATGDSVLDVISVPYEQNQVNSSTSMAISVAPGLGDGRFGAALRTELPAPHDRYNTFLTGDFDHDGDIDVVVLIAPTTTIRFYAGNDAGSFTSGAQRTVPEVRPLLSGDFNGDGRLDVGMVRPGSIEVLAGNGNGTFADPVSTVTAGLFEGVAADLNGDGRKDLVLRGQDQTLMRAYLGTANGTFSDAGGTGDDSSQSSFILGDFDGNGNADLVTVLAHAVRVRSGNGNGTFGAPTDTRAPYVYYIEAVADVDADDNLDLVTSEGVLFGNGARGFSSFADFPSQSLTIRTLAVGALDGDARIDVVRQHSDGLFDVFLAREEAGGVTTSLQVAPSGSIQTQFGQFVYLSPVVTTNQPWYVGGAIRFTPDSGGVSVQRYTPGVSVPLGAFGLGTVQVSATYVGDETHGPSSPAALEVVVVKATPWVSTSYPPVSEGGVLHLQVTLSGHSLAFAQPTGTITLRKGDTVLGNAAGPSSTFDVAGLSGGIHPLTISYAGDAFYNEVSFTREVTVYVAFGGAVHLDAKASGASVIVRWAPVEGAVTYELQRRVSAGDYAVFVSTSTPYWGDINVVSGTTYLYRVVVRRASGEATAPSAPDLATVAQFNHDPLSPGTTRIWAVHVRELRDAINAMRAAGGLAPLILTVQEGSVVSASHLQQLRDGLQQARGALGFTTAFTDALIGGQTIVRAVHWQELREQVK